MGAERVTVQGIQVVDISEDENLLFLCGAIPGPTGAIVEIRRASGGRS